MALFFVYYITLEDSIERLNLSVRSHNALRRANIHTVEKLLACSREELQSVRNLGTKSVDEICVLIDGIRNGCGEFCLVGADEIEILQLQEVPAPEIAVDTESETLYEDAPISDLTLSIRAVNCLRTAGIENVSQLIGMTRDDLLRIKNMGVLTANLIVDEIESYKASHRLVSVLAQTERESSANVTPAKTPDPDEELVLAFAEKQLLSTAETRRQIAMLREEHPEAAGETLLFLLFGQDVVRERAKTRILRYLEEADTSVGTRELFILFPSGIENTTVLEQLLLDMEREKTIYNENGAIRRRWPSVTDYVAGIRDERARDIIKTRLEGKTLAETGELFGITRERVRQIEGKYLLRGRPRLEEDAYFSLYCRYDASLLSLDHASQPRFTLYFSGAEG